MIGFKTKVTSLNDDWTNIFNSWLSINREYIEDSNFTDCCYWYNERTCVGTLSGAIWKKGGLCLEEYSSIKAKFDNDKSRDGINKEPKEVLGRTDLYFYMGKNEYLVEAKHVKGFGSLTNKINKAIKSAEDDSISSGYNESESVKQIALVFIVPYEDEKREVDFVKFEKELKERSDLDFYCSFENQTENNIEAENGNICNACYIIGKEIPRKS